MQNFCPCDLCAPKDPANEGQEVEVIRREEINEFLDWHDSLPDRWVKAFKLAEEFTRRWNKNV